MTERSAGPSDAAPQAKTQASMTATDRALRELTDSQFRKILAFRNGAQASGRADSEAAYRADESPR